MSATKKRSTQKSKPSKPFVIVRTYSAGVHAGYLESRHGQEVVLSDARRLWNWSGANTLHEISLRGVARGSKVSEPVEQILLLQAIEIITATATAARVIAGLGWGQ